MTNKERHESDEERDQSRRLDQQRAEEKHRRKAGKEEAKEGEKWQEGGFGDDRQQHARHTPRRQDGGWQESSDVERGAGRAPGADRDHDPDSDGKR